MIKKNSLPLFKFFLPVPNLSPTYGPDDVPIVSDKIQSVGILDTSVHSRAHELPQLLMCFVSICKEDATIELIGLLTQGEAEEKS